MSVLTHSLKQALEVAACTGCGLCAEVCPAVAASGDAGLSAAAKLDALRGLSRSRLGWMGRLWGGRGLGPREWADLGSRVFDCTLCGACQEACPLGIGLHRLWLDLRARLAAQGAQPAKAELLEKNLAQSHNVFGEDNEERLEWLEDLPEEMAEALEPDRADLVYFTGCVASFYPMAQKIPLALAKILSVAGVSPAVLGGNEWCCGFPLLGAGKPGEFEALRRHNLELVRAKGASQVLFACPSCYQTWREFYPHEGLRLWHTSQYLPEMVRQGRLQPGRLELTVTYHDPCDLGRGAGVLQAPRELIAQIPGVRLVEMAHNQERSLCCGGGGNLEMVNPQLSARMTALKMEEVLATGAQVVVSACQQCLRTMATHARRNKLPLEVMDLTTLLARSLSL